MRLYRTPDGQWAGTQADAAKLSKDWDQVDVPTDKPSLIDWLSFHQVGRITTPTTHPYMPEICPDEHMPEQVCPKCGTGYAEQSVGLDEQFAAAPLGQRLTLACTALEDAREAVRAVGGQG